MARLLSDLEELLGLVGDAVDAPLRHVELELAQVGLHLQPHLLLERDEVAQRVAELERRHRRRRRPTRHLRRRGQRRWLCIKVGTYSSKNPRLVWKNRAVYVRCFAHFDFMGRR